MTPRPRPLAPARACLAGCLALAMALGAAPAARASTRSQFAAAKARLTALEANIAAEQSRIATLRQRMYTNAVELQQTRDLYAQTQAALGVTQDRYTAARANFEALTTALDRAAADAYIRGGSAGLEPVIDPGAIGNLQSMVGYVSAILERQHQLAQNARVAANALAVQQREQARLVSQRAHILARLTAQENSLTRSFGEEQLRIAGLAQARAEVGALVMRLRNILNGSELAAAATATAGGMPITFGKWAAAFLNKIRAPLVRENFVAVVAWETAEYTDSRWNPLATTYSMPGATNANSAGVKNYRSLSQGLTATLKTLQVHGYGYEAILRDLRRGSSAKTTARAINASSWCHGCANGQYVVDLIPTVERYYRRFSR